jgi:hypothetical protein
LTSVKYESWRAMTEAKFFQRKEMTHVGGRGVVRGDGDSLFNHFCGRLGRRNLDGAKLGKEERQMIIRRPLLWREIAILLGAKLVALSCLYFLFFGPSHRPLADAAAVSARILGLSHG